MLVMAGVFNWIIHIWNYFFSIYFLDSFFRYIFNSVVAVNGSFHRFIRVACHVRQIIWCSNENNRLVFGKNAARIHDQFVIMTTYSSFLKIENNSVHTHTFSSFAKFDIVVDRKCRYWTPLMCKEKRAEKKYANDIFQWTRWLKGNDLKWVPHKSQIYMITLIIM